MLIFSELCSYENKQLFQLQGDRKIENKGRSKLSAQLFYLFIMFLLQVNSIFNDLFFILSLPSFTMLQ